MPNSFSNSIDEWIEKTVILSFSRIGYAIRKHFWEPEDLDANLSGKTCVVTGANSGLGFETSKQLAKRGARVYMLVRDPVRGEEAKQRVCEEAGNAQVFMTVVDLSHLQDVKDFVEKFVGYESRLDVLVNNAGVLLDRRECAEEGVEKTFATNVLGPFLLTNLLLPLMRDRESARIINVSSGGMYAQKLDLEKLQSQEEPFNGVVAYAQTKRAQVVLTELWAKRLSGHGISVYAMHPGWVDTPGLTTSLSTFAKVMKPLLRTPLQGVDTILWLAITPHLNSLSGTFWHDRKPRSAHKTPRTVSSSQERQELWELCETRSGWREGDHSIPSLGKIKGFSDS